MRSRLLDRLLALALAGAPFVIGCGADDGDAEGAESLDTTEEAHAAYNSRCIELNTDPKMYLWMYSELSEGDFDHGYSLGKASYMLSYCWSAWPHYVTDDIRVELRVQLWKKNPAASFPWSYCSGVTHTAHGATPKLEKNWQKDDLCGSGTYRTRTLARWEHHPNHWTNFRAVWSDEHALKQ